MPWEFIRIFRCEGQLPSCSVVLSGSLFSRRTLEERSTHEERTLAFFKSVQKIWIQAQGDLQGLDPQLPVFKSALGHELSGMDVFDGDFDMFGHGESKKGPRVFSKSLVLLW